MATSAIAAVSAAVYGVLIGDATLMGLTTGGWHDALPDRPIYPAGYVEVRQIEARGFGTAGPLELEIRTHSLSQRGAIGAKRTATLIDDRVQALLKDAALTVGGFVACDRVFYDETVPLSETEIMGVKVFEFVSNFRVFVEAA